MSELTERLRGACIDWDGTEEKDLAEPVHFVSCGDLRSAADALEAQEARIKELEESAKTAAMYLRTGFIECERCGHEVETKNTDAWFELRETLSKAPSIK